MGCGAPDDLIRDRLAEFQELAQSRGTLIQDVPAVLGKPRPSARLLDACSASVATTAMTGDAPGAGAGKSRFMKDFFDQINMIQTSINKGGKSVKAMEGLLDDVLQATTHAKEAEVQQRIQDLMDDTNAHITCAKKGLESLRSKTESDKSRSGAEAKIQSNMQQAMAKKLQQLLMEFQTSQLEFKRALEKRQAKEMQILMPQASEEERREMIENGETAQVMITRKMGGAHALLLDEVGRVREKYQAVLNLERSIAELCQMFQDMAVLVEAQGEMLDAIEVNVHQTNVYMSKAETELKTTRKYQQKNRKQMLCLIIVFIVILIIILAPILSSVL